MNSALAMDVYFWLAHRLERRDDQGAKRGREIWAEAEVKSPINAERL
jgi:hypothetical protein